VIWWRKPNYRRLRVEVLYAELEMLRQSSEILLRMPPREWVEERVTRIQEILEQRTSRSALLLRQLLGTIRMEATTPEVGRPYYRARTNLDILAILDNEPRAAPDGREPGSNPLRWWRRRESTQLGCCAPHLARPTGDPGYFQIGVRFSGDSIRLRYDAARRP
jgi:hypothetical protein